MSELAVSTGSHPDELIQPRSAVTPHEWAAVWKGPFLEAISRNPNKSAAARQVGISYAMVKKARREDREFAEALLEATEIGVDLLRQIAHRRATIGEPRKVIRRRTRTDETGKVVETEVIETEEVWIDNSLLMALLKAYAPEFRDRMDHRHTGGDEGPIQVEVSRRPTRERMLGLVRLARELEVPDDVIEGTGRVIENGDGGE